MEKQTSEFQAILKKAEKHSSQIIAQFQYDMAKETEGKELNTDEVYKGIKYLADNPDLGFFMLAHDPIDQSKEIGSLLITYAHEVFLNKSVWWFQSVFVNGQYRGKGIFKQMFLNVEEKVESQKYPLKLYVETENERAMAVYQKMGMSDAQEIYLEDDFYFEDKITFQKSDNFSYKPLDLMQKIDIDFLYQNIENYSSDFGYPQANKEKVLLGIQHIKQHPNQGMVVQISQSSKVIAYVGIFYEFSDWRNGVIVYISDVRIHDQISQHINRQELYNGLFYYLKHQQKYMLPLTCLRVIIKENLEIVKTISNIGMETAHYRIYIKQN